MPAAARIGDSCTGHGCYPPRVNVEGSSDVFINGLAAHCQTHAYVPHGCSVCAPHGGTLATGSATVYINGLQAGRIGDPVDCGSSVAQGSSDVSIGG